MSLRYFLLGESGQQDDVNRPPKQTWMKSGPARSNNWRLVKGGGGGGVRERRSKLLLLLLSPTPPPPPPLHKPPVVTPSLPLFHKPSVVTVTTEGL